MPQIPKTINEKLDEGRQYRFIELPNFEVRADDGDDPERIVEGYATVFNEPYELWSYDGYTVLEQIDSKGYAIPYQTDCRRIVKVGVKFNADTRVPEDWVAE